MKRPLLGALIPPLGGEYGHDLAETPHHPTWPCRFDPIAAYGPLVEARRCGAQAVRVFLCEGAEGVRLDASGAIDGVSERLLESVAIVQEAARLHGLYVYWSVLDAASIVYQQDHLTAAILSDPAVTARFATRVVAPLVRALDPRLTLGLEAVCAPAIAAEAHGWAPVGAALRAIGDAARGEAELLVTAGTKLRELGALLAHDPKLDALDLHIDDGRLPTVEDLARLSGHARAAELPRLVGSLEVEEGETHRAVVDRASDGTWAAIFTRLEALAH